MDSFKSYSRVARKQDHITVIDQAYGNNAHSKYPKLKGDEGDIFTLGVQKSGQQAVSDEIIRQSDSARTNLQDNSTPKDRCDPIHIRDR